MHKSVYRKKPLALYLLIFLLTLQSLTALICGASMMWEPSGVSMNLAPQLLDSSPFRSFFLPGFFLFTCLGALPLLAVYELLSSRGIRIFRRINFYDNYKPGWMLSLFCGFGTLIWITAQLYFTKTFHFLQTVYATVGLLILVMSLLPATMKYCNVVSNSDA